MQIKRIMSRITGVIFSECIKSKGIYGVNNLNTAVKTAQDGLVRVCARTKNVLFSVRETKSVFLCAENQAGKQSMPPQKSVFCVRQSGIESIFAAQGLR